MILEVFFMVIFAISLIIATFFFDSKTTRLQRIQIYFHASIAWGVGFLLFKIHDEKYLQMLESDFLTISTCIFLAPFVGAEVLLLFYIVRQRFK